MSGTDAYDRWLAGNKEHIYDTLFDTDLGDLPLKPAAMLPLTATVHEAVDQMNREGIGAVLVGEGRRIDGIFTERDLLRKVVSARLDPDETPLAAVMTAAPECLHRTNSLAQALNLMVLGGYRNVPVLDDVGCAVGVFSMGTWVEFCVELFPQEILNARPPQPYSLHREGA